MLVYAYTLQGDMTCLRRALQHMRGASFDAGVYILYTLQSEMMCLRRVLQTHERNII